MKCQTTANQVNCDDLQFTWGRGREGGCGTEQDLLEHCSCDNATGGGEATPTPGLHNPGSFEIHRLAARPRPGITDAQRVGVQGGLTCRRGRRISAHPFLRPCQPTGRPLPRQYKTHPEQENPPYARVRPKLQLSCVRLLFNLFAFSLPYTMSLPPGFWSDLLRTTSKRNSVVNIAVIGSPECGKSTFIRKAVKDLHPEALPAIRRRGYSSETLIYILTALPILYF